MTGPVAPAGGWRVATVSALDHPGPTAVRIRLEVPDRIDHWPGQHYVIRLTAADGYVAQRSYSIASSPTEPGLELFVARLPDGEVSTFLADELRVGDRLEVRGPIGGWFVWTGDRPAVLVGGGSGVVPFVAMHRWAAASSGVVAPPATVVAARSPEELPYRDELLAAGAQPVYSRADGPGHRRAGRLGGADLVPVLPPDGDADYFVCGSTGFAESVTGLLLGLGVAAPRIRVERFGPSG